VQQEVLIHQGRDVRMEPRKLKLRLFDEKFCLSKLPVFAELPHVFMNAEMVFISRTEDELAVICPEFMAPTNVQQEAGWRCIRVQGEFTFTEVGVLASLATPLAAANIPILAISTFDSDYVFLMEENLVPATQALQHAGHEFIHEE
jgi:hypothetical protein